MFRVFIFHWHLQYCGVLLVKRGYDSSERIYNAEPADKRPPAGTRISGGYQSAHLLKLLLVHLITVQIVPTIQGWPQALSTDVSS